MNKISVVLYTREGCSLCSDAHDLLKYLSYEFPLEITLFDITTDPTIEKKYMLEIPVVEVNGEEAFVLIIEDTPLRELFQSIVNNKIMS